MTTPEKSVEEIVEEFGNHIGHMDKMVEPHYIMCQKEKHEGEMCGCEVAHMLTEQKDWLTQTLQAERQKGEEMVEKIQSIPYGTNGEGKRWIMKDDLDEILQALTQPITHP